jgi:hypothetical protein
MQRHVPKAATGPQRSTDCVRTRGPALEGNREVLVFGPLTTEASGEPAVIADLAVDYCRALKWIETEAVLPD